MVDLTLTDEQKDLREMAHNFAEKEIRPVAWEYDRLKPIIFSTREDKPRKFRLQFLTIPAFFAIGGVAAGIFAWLIRLGNFPNYLTIGLALTAIGFVFGVVVAVHYRMMPVGHLIAERSGSIAKI